VAVNVLQGRWLLAIDTMTQHFDAQRRPHPEPAASQEARAPHRRERADHASAVAGILVATASSPEDEQRARQ